MFDTFAVLTAAAILSTLRKKAVHAFGLALNLAVSKGPSKEGISGCRSFEYVSEEARLRINDLTNRIIDCCQAGSKKKPVPKVFGDRIRLTCELLSLYFGRNAKKTLTNAQIDQIEESYNLLMKEIAPAVIRRPDEAVLADLTNFVDSISGEHNPLDAFLDTYFAVYLPENLRDEHGSDHLTVAFSEEKKVEFFTRLGEKVSILKGKNVVYWTADNGDEYAYRAYKVIFEDGTTVVTHNSIHLPDGGKSYKFNHEHQTNAPEPEWEETMNNSLFISFQKKKSVEFLCTFDFDGVLFDQSNLFVDGEFVPSKLKDASLICEENLTVFGKFVLGLGIPFRLVTSRRRDPKSSEVDSAIKSVFPNCVETTYGKAIKASGKLRDAYKAEDKCTRMVDGMLHFDDEDIVVHTCGYGVIVRDQSTPVHYHKEQLSGRHVTFGLFGTVGAGKSTLIRNFIKSIGGVSVLNDDGVSPLVMVAAADASDGDHKTLPFRAFASAYPNRDTYFIFDTTGAGRDHIPFPVFYLEPEMDETTIAGSLVSLLNRTGHPNLNGLGDVDLSAPEAKRDLWDTNSMNLTEFINYLWSTRGGSQFAFEEVMTRMGQTVKFSSMNGIQFVLTSYREGSQNWSSIWGRQNRKCVHYLVDGKWKMLKSGLEVGAEMKPDTHAEDGDVYMRKLSSFQDQVRWNLFTGAVLPDGTTVTSKKDGSLIQITRVIEDVDTLYSAIMSDENDNEFVKMMAKKSYEASGRKYFFIVSTNGTLCAAKHMWDYIVTAAACDFGMSFSEDTPVLDAWKEVLPFVVEREMKFWNNNPHHFLSNATHQMEAICPLRTTYLGTVHTELAMSYPTGGLTSLGVRCEELYVPHFQMEKHLNEVGYEQPLFWTTSDSWYILDMLTGIQRISTDADYSEEDFLKDYQPNNEVMPKDAHVDHEGFVLLVKVNARKQWDYGKIKTALYYVCHKPRECHMSDLIEFAKTAKTPWFPIVGAIRNVQENISKVDIKVLDEGLREIYHNPDYHPKEPTEEELEAMTVVAVEKEYAKKTTKPTEADVSRIRKKLEDKAEARVSSFQKKLTGSSELLRAFLLGNNPHPVSSLQMNVFKHILTSYGLEETFEKFTSLPVDLKKGTLEERQLGKKFTNSLSTINDLAKSPHSNVETLHRHLMYLAVTFQK